MTPGGQAMHSHGPSLRLTCRASFVFEKDRQISLEYKKDLLDLMCMRGIALPRRHKDDAEGKAAGRDRRRVVVLAGPAGADKAMLGAAVAFDLGILEGFPIGLSYRGKRPI